RRVLFRSRSAGVAGGGVSGSSRDHASMSASVVASTFAQSTRLRSACSRRFRTIAIVPPLFPTRRPERDDPAYHTWILVPVDINASHDPVPCCTRGDGAPLAVVASPIFPLDGRSVE